MTNRETGRCIRGARFIVTPPANNCRVRPMPRRFISLIGLAAVALVAAAAAVYVRWDRTPAPKPPEPAADGRDRVRGGLRRRVRHARQVVPREARRHPLSVADQLVQ